MTAQLLHITDLFFNEPPLGVHISAYIFAVLPATRDFALEAIILPSAEYIGRDSILTSAVMEYIRPKHGMTGIPCIVS